MGVATYTDKHLIVDGYRLLTGLGAAATISSGGDLTLGSGNTFTVSPGTGGVLRRISGTDWISGSHVALRASSTLTITGGSSAGSGFYPVVVPSGSSATVATGALALFWFFSNEWVLLEIVGSSSGVDQIDYDPSATSVESENLLLNPGAESPLADSGWQGAIQDGTARKSWAWVHLNTPEPLVGGGYPVPNKLIFGSYVFFGGTVPSGGWKEIYQIFAVPSEYLQYVDAGTATFDGSATFFVDGWVFDGDYRSDAAIVRTGFFGSQGAAEAWQNPLATFEYGYAENATTGTGSVSRSITSGTRYINTMLRWGLSRPDRNSYSSWIDNVSATISIPLPGLSGNVGSEAVQVDNTESPTATVAKWIKSGTGAHDWEQTWPSVVSESPDPVDAEIDEDGALLDSSAFVNVTSALATWIAMSIDGYKIGDTRKVMFACAASAEGAVPVAHDPYIGDVLISVNASMASIDFGTDDQSWSSIRPDDVFQFMLCSTGWRML